MLKEQVVLVWISLTRVQCPVQITGGNKMKTDKLQDDSNKLGTMAVLPQKEKRKHGDKGTPVQSHCRH